MAARALIGIDIGATSIKAGAFDERGEQLALATRPNAPAPQDPLLGWYAWDADQLWAAVCSALREVSAAVEPVAVAVTGFGADGAPFAPDGTQRYPVISWHDSRAADDLAAIEEQVGERALYDLTGYHGYPINTLCRWRWLTRNAPEALEDATWLMVPDIVAFKLTGEQRTDATAASTTMAFDLAAGSFATGLIESVGVSPALLAPLVAPGSPVGTVTAQAAQLTGLPAGIPVVAAGHDGEAVAFAAGALPEGTALDVSGTWELVILRHERFEPSDAFFAHGIDWEADAVPGRFLCIALMPSGSVVNWVRDLAYGGSTDWRQLVAEAGEAPVGARGVRVIPAFVRGMGPYAQRPEGGSIEGLQTTSTRSDLARATFEGLCFQLRTQLRVLERVHAQPLERLRVTGGAQRNPFWLQLKADMTGCACEAVPHEELTLLGAALLAGVGAGVYASVAEAQSAATREPRVIEPDQKAAAAYDELLAPLERERVPSMIEQLVALSRKLGAPENDYAVLAEGNTSAVVDEHRLVVKASGTSLRDATAASFLEVDADALLALLDDPPASEEEQNEALAACATRPGSLRPSVEAPLHAVAARHGGAQVVAHTHPTAVNAILCSEHADDIVRPLFPDQIVVCGAEPLLLPYTDPGLPLARAFRDALLARPDRPPKTVYLRNHGLVALAETPHEALQITAMAVKAARILGGAFAAGGPVFLSDSEAAAIDERLDEHFRRAMLARHRA